MAIVATLAGITIPVVLDHKDKANLTKAVADIRSVELKIEMAAVQWGRYPDSLDEIGEGSLLDPWGNPYAYLNIANAPTNSTGTLRKDHNLVPLNSDYDLYSSGKDGESRSPLTAKASRDDILRANDGGFVGLATDY